MNLQISTDLLVHCLRKIVRRLNKIENMLLSVDSNDIKQWIDNVTEQIKEKLQFISSNSDWQSSMKRNEENNRMIQLNPNQPEIYKHSCAKLKSYLNKHHYINPYRHLTDDYNRIRPTLPNVSEGDQLPSIADFTNQAKYTTGIALTRIEIWVERCLEQWINSSSQSESEAKRFENLLCFFEDYQRSALNHYCPGNNSLDPIGYSRYILTSLTVIYLMHKKLCENKKFERLKSHAIQIPYLVELFEFLVLPNRDDMTRARNLYDYFHVFSQKQLLDLLTNISSMDAFGAFFASQSETMKKSLEQIQIQAADDRNNKIEEVIREKERYDQLIKVASDLECECDLTLYSRKCTRCNIIQQANNIKVSVYECPIPADEQSAFAVIFELQMPNKIRCYRDVIWEFINRRSIDASNQMLEWLNVPSHGSKLQRFYNGSSKCKIKLVSSSKSITQSHYSAPQQIASTPLEKFLYENSLKVQISPTEPVTFQSECLILTPQLTDSNYKPLQYSIDSTQFAQNRVIAELSKCSLSLKPTQFIEFGSFRSGHRLQWWNLLSVLEFESLPMDVESVAIIITHSLLQYGPVTINPDKLIYSWCSESHQQLLDDNFVDELLSRLDRRLKECESNWQNELVLAIITIIIMRMFTVCNSVRKSQIINLILKCRSIGEKWIRLISENIQNPSSTEFDKVDALRDKIATIGVVSLLTFSIHTDQIDSQPFSNENVISLLKLITTVHDNMILSKKQTSSSVFIRNLMQINDRILISIHPNLSKFLQSTSYQSLNEFATSYWAVIRDKDITNGKWGKRSNDIYDGWYDGQYGSVEISIDCLRGTFLVNGMTIGFLPERITSNHLFQRVFGHHTFEVQTTESDGTYITKHGYHTDGKIHYEFSFDDRNQRLIIRERHTQTDDKFELIPPNCFEAELPDLFISNSSHWKNLKKEHIEFRPISFRDSNFLNDKDYILTTKTGFITTNNTDKTQILINQSSSFFQNLFKRYFIHLDDQSYMYMLRDNAAEITETKSVQTGAIIHIYLSRLGIAFRYDTQRNMITSREYSDIYVNEDQWFGTLTCLKAGLLLSPMQVNNPLYTSYLCRKVIIPFGQVHAERISDKDHQIVTIERKSSTPFLHQYFVFVLNDRLRILQSTDSPTGWLYLALLHAMTSHPLPDQYTGMTGMERSFQLLNSAGCWSDQPYDPISLNILFQIATISPKVNYYPEHLTCMEKLDWNSQSFPYSMQHFGYYLIAKKLVETSQQWNFMHPTNTSSELHELFKSKKYNEQLLAKLYWDYRDSYNSTARLSTQMEAEIQRTISTKPYQPVWNNYSHSTNYSSLQLLDSFVF